MKYFTFLLAVALGTAFMPSAYAVVVFADDFSEADGTFLNGKLPDVGVGAWFVDSGLPQTIQNGVVDTADLVGTVGVFGGTSSGGFTDSLSTGEQLRLSFSTVATAGNFHGGSTAGLWLYQGNVEQILIGSTESTSNVWRAQSGASASITNVSGAAQNGVFNYEFDTGNWNLSFGGIGTYAQSGTFNPGLPLDRFRFVGQNAQSIALDSVSVEIAPTPVLPSVPAAFPGAVGQGAVAAGGRGGDVYRVTNLLDNEFGTPTIPGSLRDAIESANSPRTIVFDVGGNLELTRRLFILDKDNLTIAGQTSPSGITLSGYPLRVENSDDLILRHLRLRPGDFNADDGMGGGNGNADLMGTEADALRIDLSDRVIVDSVSASWSIDETIDIGRSKDVTVQNSIISEGLDASVHPSGDHSRGALVRAELTDAEQAAGTGGITFYGNLLASQARRSPGVGGSDTDPTLDADINVVNNVIYNFGQVAANRESLGGVRANVVGNYFISGPDSPGNDVVFEEGLAATTEVYQEGNFRDSDQDIIHDGSLISNALQAAAFTGFSGADVLLNSSTGSAFNFFSSVAADVLSAEAAYSKVVSSVGASLFRDAIDTRIIAELEGRTGSIIDSQEIFRIGGIIDGLDNLPTVFRPAGFDTDGDGIPNAFEILNGLDPNDPDDRNFVDISLVGYTNLEVYLNSLTALAGDFDEDGDVDGFDFLTWQRGFGTTFTAGDLTDWASNYGTGVSPLAAGSGLAASAAAVPEPSTAMLISLALVGLASTRSRRK